MHYTVKVENKARQMSFCFSFSLPQVYAILCTWMLSVLLANEVVGWTPSTLFASWHHQTNSHSPRWWLQVHSIIALVLEITTIVAVLTYSSYTRKLPKLVHNALNVSLLAFTAWILINFWNFGTLPTWLAVFANLGLLSAFWFFAIRYQRYCSIYSLFGFLAVLSLDNYDRLLKMSENLHFF